VGVLLVWVVGAGCTSLREIPRQDYVSRVQDRPVRVVTTEGLVYELDMATVVSDTLVGYHRRDVAGPIEEFDTLRWPLEHVEKISARGIDWYRTGLIGGLSLAVVVAAGMSRTASEEVPPPFSPCGKGECP
jgi:hypothetical protein